MRGAQEDWMMSENKKGSKITVALVALFVSVGIGCATDLDVDETIFACDGDGDCVEGYRCAEGPEGEDVCQPEGELEEPNNQEPNNQEPNNQEPNNQEPNNDEDPPECEVGDEQSCDCGHLDFPYREGMEGVQSCGDDEEWLDCQCPEVCKDEAQALMVEGEECGVCGQGTISCDDGVAECSDVGPVNACGGCQETDSTPNCLGDERLVCQEGEIPTCEEVVSDDGTLTIVGPDDEQWSDDMNVYYSIAQDVGDGACPDGWAMGAVKRPGSYRSASSIEELEYAVDRIADGTDGDLRVVIQQPMELEGGDEETVSTHTGCAEFEAGDSEFEVEVEPLQTLMRGDYRFSFQPPIATEAVPGQEPGPLGNPDDYWDVEAHDWTMPGLENFMSSPGSLLVGCEEGEDCPHEGESGLFEHYDGERSRSDVPTLGIWSAFYEDYEQWIEGLEASEVKVIREAYKALFDEHMAFIQGELEARYQLIQSNFDGDSGHFEPLVHHFPEAQLKGTYRWGEVGQGTPEMEIVGVELGIFRGYPLRRDCSATDDEVCHQPVEPVVDRESAAGEVNFSLESFAGSEGAIRSVVMELPSNELLRRLFFDYVPGEIYPRMEAEEIDDGVFEYRVESWESLGDLYRTVAPCEAVVAELEDRDFEATGAVEQFCEDAYGDEEGKTALDGVSQLAPLDTREDYELTLGGLEYCGDQFAGDPYQTLRFERYVPEDSFFDPCASEFADLQPTDDDLAVSWPVGRQDLFVESGFDPSYFNWWEGDDEE